MESILPGGFRADDRQGTGHDKSRFHIVDFLVEVSRPPTVSPLGHIRGFQVDEAGLPWRAAEGTFPA
ncbi:hypothetical protein [Roseococcus pinisoli]|uniref:Transposase n=1 Tax=Roseococcus pinisoli TaxID=2835040 RepID=A0ABS5QBU1_9PROT|nr:hypothetical protein [Roseococcus pinisoli]MBS7810425.1 hypothetical protein [Roseococcus pinisoli]